MSITNILFIENGIKPLNTMERNKTNVCEGYIVDIIFGSYTHIFKSGRKITLIWIY